jgi:hypothetical protein
MGRRPALSRTGCSEGASQRLLSASRVAMWGLSTFSGGTDWPRRSGCRSPGCHRPIAWPVLWSVQEFVGAHKQPGSVERRLSHTALGVPTAHLSLRSHRSHENKGLCDVNSVESHSKTDRGRGGGHGGHSHGSGVWFFRRRVRLSVPVGPYLVGLHTAKPPLTVLVRNICAIDERLLNHRWTLTVPFYQPYCEPGSATGGGRQRHPHLRVYEHRSNCMHVVWLPGIPAHGVKWPVAANQRPVGTGNQVCRDLVPRWSRLVYHGVSRPDRIRQFDVSDFFGPACDAAQRLSLRDGDRRGRRHSSLRRHDNGSALWHTLRSTRHRDSSHVVRCGRDGMIPRRAPLPPPLSWARREAVSP